MLLEGPLGPDGSGRPFRAALFGHSRADKGGAGRFWQGTERCRQGKEASSRRREKRLRREGLLERRRDGAGQGNTRFWNTIRHRRRSALQRERRPSRFPKKRYSPFCLRRRSAVPWRMEGKWIGEFESATKRYPIYACRHRGIEVCLCQAPVGATAAVQILDYLISRGVTQVVSTGACGVLSDIPENQFLVPVSALAGRGAFRITISRLLGNCRLRERGAGSRKGFAAGGASVYGGKNVGDGRLLPGNRGNGAVPACGGCQAVEMECAGLAACAAFGGSPGRCCCFLRIL